MHLDIISVGSATVDVFVNTARDGTEIKDDTSHHDVCYHIGEKVLIKELTMSTGGGGTNTAVAFARLGLAAGWLGALGDDANADIVRKALKQEKVKVIGSKVHGSTGYSVIIRGLEHNRTILAYKGANDQLVSSASKLLKWKPKWLYCSAMLGPSLITLKKICKQARKQAIPYTFNPSMYLARQGLHALKGIVDGCTLLVLNKEEAAALVGSNTTTNVQQMLRILRQHASVVVITDGSNGASAYDGKKMHLLAAHKVKVVETTGAGDAFAAGVTAGLLQGQTLARALKLGLAESESVIQHVGAKKGLLKKHLLSHQNTKISRRVS